MSAATPPNEPRSAPHAPPHTPPPRDMFGGRPIGGLGMPTQKAKNFKGTLVRLLETCEPYREIVASQVSLEEVA